MIYTLNTELHDREIFLIGSIVSQWGFLESDIYEQTLLSFEGEEGLPASMNNAQFSAVLKLWLRRVVKRQPDESRMTVLQSQFEEIVSLSEYRQAVVHSRWEWRPDAPDEITAVRVHNKSILRVKFTADGLFDLSTRLGQVRYRIRYPGGTADRAAEMSAVGGYITRQGYDLLEGRATFGSITRRSDAERGS